MRSVRLAVFAFLTVQMTVMSSLSGQLAVGVGENLLDNPGFSFDFLGEIGGWSVTGATAGEVFRQEEGPGGESCVEFDSDKCSAAFTLRQGGLKLVQGGCYELAGWIRAERFSSSGVGLLVVNAGWTWSIGLNFGDLTCGWQRFSKVVRLDGESKDGIWSVAFHSGQFRGRIAIANVSLCPVDRRTAERTRFSDRVEAEKSPRLIPIDPLLSNIGKERKIRFAVCGRLPAESCEDMEVFLVAGGCELSFPLAGRNVMATIPGCADEGELVASVRVRKTGRVVTTRTFRFRSGGGVPNPTKGRRLNNLVVEYDRRQIASGGSCMLDLRFDEGQWLYVRSPGRVALDGRALTPVVTRAMVREHYAWTSAGEHRLLCEGKGDGELVVRRVPETFDYQIRDNGLFRRYVRGCLTTLSCSRLPKADLDSFRASGCLRLDNVPVQGLLGSGAMQKRVLAVSAEDYDGFSCDEAMPWDSKMVSDIAAQLWAVTNFMDCLVYTWAVGKPFAQGPNLDLLSAAVNASDSRGRLLNEAYCVAPATEAEAGVVARDWLGGTRRAWSSLSQPLMRGCATVVGAFTDVDAGWSLAPHAQVDFRCFLDLLFNVLATDPDFCGLPMTGVWGSNYSDPELLAWTFRVMRHYCVEGNTSRLSDRYGLRYTPGHISNGDFLDGLKGWQTHGEVQPDSIIGMGRECEFRDGRCGLSCGDTFAVLHPGAEISQVAVRLKPGRSYVLDLTAFSVDDVRAKRRDPNARMAISVVVENAQVDPMSHKSWEVLRREKSTPAAAVNRHRLYFRAKGVNSNIIIRSDDPRIVGVNNIRLAMSVLTDESGSDL